MKLEQRLYCRFDIHVLSGYRFRWVTCQIDHICALSNDRSRRRALDSLPPDLPTTYERILDRVNGSAKENRIIVQRTLRWILWAVCPLPLAALSEAISVSIGDQMLDREAVVDPEAILQWCGSLVRRVPGVDILELAHYSVKEFLQGIDAHVCSPYMEYRANVAQDGLELAKTCLTYLCFEDFDLDESQDSRKMMSFFKDYRFLRYCVQHWDNHARITEDDESLVEMVQGWMNNRTNQYSAWMCWIACIGAEWRGVDKYREQDVEMDYNKIESLLWVMADSSQLHWAATLSLPSLCRRLMANNCNVNQYVLARPCLQDAYQLDQDRSNP